MSLLLYAQLAQKGVSDTVTRDAPAERTVGGGRWREADPFSCTLLYHVNVSPIQNE